MRKTTNNLLFRDLNVSFPALVLGMKMNHFFIFVVDNLSFITHTTNDRCERGVSCGQEKNDDDADAVVVVVLLSSTKYAYEERCYSITRVKQ